MHTSDLIPSKQNINGCDESTSLSRYAPVKQRIIQKEMKD